MTQMVLLHNPSPNEAGQKPAEPAGQKSGDSQFDQVSRAEEKRLARKQAEREEARQQPAKPDHSQSPEKPDGKATRKGQDAAAGTKPDKLPADDQAGEQALASEALLPGAPTAEQVFNELFGIDPEDQQPLFSFAGLQSMVGQQGTPGLVPGA